MARPGGTRHSIVSASVVIALAVATCSGEPELELAECTGRGAITPEAQHTLEIYANGHVRVDGVGFAEGDDLDAALDQLRGTMRADDEMALYVGRSRAIGEPLLARIDGATPFSTAAYWLDCARSRHDLYVLWLAVNESATGLERCLKLAHPPSPPIGCMAGGEDGLPRVRDGLMRGVPVVVRLHAATRPLYESTRTHAPWWFVVHWQLGEPSELEEFDGWPGARERVRTARGEQRLVSVMATFSASTPWRDVVPVVADSLELWDARIELTSEFVP